MLFLLLALTTFQARAQKHNSNIPNNGKIVTVQDWLVTDPIPGEYLMSNTPTPGYPSDFLTAIGGEKSPKIVADQPFNTPDGKTKSIHPENVTGEKEMEEWQLWNKDQLLMSHDS